MVSGDTSGVCALLLLKLPTGVFGKLEKTNWRF